MSGGRPKSGSRFRGGARGRIAACLLLVSTHAFADPDVSTTAEKLFRDGRDLLERGRTHEACELFERSAKIEEKVGTSLNLAACRQLQGRTGSAWQAYAQARAIAARSNDEKYERFAAERMETLAPRLSKIVVRGKCVGKLLRDNSEFPCALMGTPVLVDPGSHELILREDGFSDWVHTFEIQAGDIVSINLPERTLKAPLADPLASSQGSDAKRSDTMRLLAWSSFALSGAAVVLGAVSGGITLGEVSDLREACPAYGSSGAVCPASLEPNQRRAETWATVSTVSFIAAGVFAGVGTVLFVTSSISSTARSARSPHWDLALRAGLGSASIHVRF